MKREVRKSIIENSYKAGACHISSALSCVGILVEIYRKMRKGDSFFFSKVSGCAALYAILAEKGGIPKSKVAYYLEKYPLVSKKVPGIVHGIGSLGHGLPVACGLALGDRKRNVYVLMSDGEIQEGTTWESLLFARQHKLKNLKVYVDRNHLQALGNTEKILGIEKALRLLKQLFPIKVVETKKGWPVDFMKGYEWHYKNLDVTLYEKAIKQV